MGVEQTRKRRKISLATQVFIGLGLGILVGVFFGERVAFLKIAGDGHSDFPGSLRCPAYDAYSGPFRWPD